MREEIYTLDQWRESAPTKDTARPFPLPLSAVATGLTSIQSARAQKADSGRTSYIHDVASSRSLFLLVLAVRKKVVAFL